MPPDTELVRRDDHFTLPSTTRFLVESQVVPSLLNQSPLALAPPPSKDCWHVVMKPRLGVLVYLPSPSGRWVGSTVDPVGVVVVVVVVGGCVVVVVDPPPELGLQLAAMSMN